MSTALQAIPEIDYKETTPCGTVRYTINPDTDEVTYCYFTFKAGAGIVCKDCRGWQALCRQFQELKEWMEELQ
jgi:hypothetical protein